MGPVSATVFHVVGHVRQRHHRHQRRQINLHRLVIRRIRVGGQRDKVRLAALRLQEARASPRPEGNTDVVAPSSAPMLAMVARSGMDSVSTPGPVYSITLPTPPLTVRRRSSSRIHVLGGHTSAEPPREAHAYHAGAAEIIRAATHGHRHVQPARADGDHAQRAAGGGCGCRCQAAFCPACRCVPAAPDGRCRCPACLR